MPEYADQRADGKYRASPWRLCHSGYGFIHLVDNRAQWKTDEFKSGLDAVINGLREDKMPLHNRYDMTDFCRRHKDSAFPGNYCTEYGFRVDTEKHAFLLRCNLSKGDYNFTVSAM